LTGDADRYDHREGNDDYTQAGDLFRLMNADQQAQLFANIAAAMHGVPQEIVQRQLPHFERADPAYAAGVNRALAEAACRNSRDAAPARQRRCGYNSRYGNLS